VIGASTRYVPHIVALIAITAVPTLLHHAHRLDVDGCADPSALLVAPGRLAEGAGPDAARAAHYTKMWGAENWSHGVVPLLSPSSRLESLVVRSFDPKVVYHWPETRVASGRPDRRVLQEAGRNGRTLPIHHPFYDSVDSRRGTVRVARYLLAYHAEPVSNAYRAQLLAAPVELVTGRQPMWLFFVYGDVSPEEREEAEEAALDWLFSAWDRYQAACAPPGRRASTPRP
jgi:hypothetical protein